MEEINKIDYKSCRKINCTDILSGLVQAGQGSNAEEVDNV